MQSIDAIMHDCVQAVLNMRNPSMSGMLPPEASYKHVREHIDKMMGRALAAGMSRDDVQAMTFAVVSLADHMASKIRGPLADHWRLQPLQAHYFPGTVRSQAFFDYIDKARRRNATSVLRAFALALALGYRGTLSPLESEKLLQDLVTLVQPRVGSQRSLLGGGRQRKWRVRDARLLWLPAGAVLSSGALYLILSSIMRNDATVFMGLIDTLTKAN